MPPAPPPAPSRTSRPSHSIARILEEKHVDVIIKYVLNIILLLIGMCILSSAIMLCKHTATIKAEDAKRGDLDYSCLVAQLMGYCTIGITILYIFITHKNSAIWKISYFVFLCCLFIMFVVWVVLFQINRQALLDNVPKIMKEVWNSEKNAHLVSVLHFQYNCCGRNGYDDYDVPPRQCCQNMRKNCTGPVFKKKPGCAKQLQGKMSILQELLVYFGIIAAALLLILIILNIAVFFITKPYRRDSKSSQRSSK